ncbi:MAG: response regulator transcription factor [Candidatus Moranbacteria bacterium]|nr:response regulator transcription factor [Candidatus Moranbacteria bacterium]
MKILIIEDNEDIAESLKMSLEEHCFAVDVAKDGESGAYLAKTNNYDLIILDYVLPKKDGYQVCKEIRERKSDVYIIAMSVKTDVETKVDLLETGADDYIIKPFSFSEVLARINALLRRSRDIKPPIIKFDDFTLDTRNYSVKKGDEEIYLTRKEAMILETLAKNKGRIVSRSMIFEEVYDTNADFLSNAIEMHIRNLRKKLGGKKDATSIKTFPGRGYMIEG